MKVYELLDKPEKWCQGCYAKDQHGNKIGNPDLSVQKDVNSENACSWCLEGAFIKCYGSTYHPKWDTLRGKIREIQWEYSPHYWNDAPERTWEDVYNLCKELDI